jgi:predicted transcriptional regulator
VGPDEPLDAVYKRMAKLRISAVPVVDATGKALGVVSSTDLVRVGRLQPASIAGMQTIDLPNEPVRMHMHEGVTTVGPDAGVKEIATLLVEQRIHRVFVREGDAIEGVVSIEDLLLAVRSLHLVAPIAEHMTKTVRTLPLSTTIARATTELDHAGVQGFIVLDAHGQPAGAFTQVEALGCRDLLPDTTLESVMSHGVLSMHPSTPLFRAAAAAYEARARRVLAVDEGKIVGLITGLDFAKALARS